MGDVNHDKRVDVLAGDYWFEAPDWKRHEIRPPGQYEFEKGYSRSFVNGTEDVNGDGWIDVIVIGMPG